jgi:hypothetical protein
MFSHIMVERNQNNTIEKKLIIFYVYHDIYQVHWEIFILHVIPHTLNHISEPCE